MKVKMLDLNLFITPAASLTFQGIDGGETIWNEDFRFNRKNRSFGFFSEI